MLSRRREVSQTRFSRATRDLGLGDAAVLVGVDLGEQLLEHRGVTPAMPIATMFVAARLARSACIALAVTVALAPRRVLILLGVVARRGRGLRA